MSVSSTSTDAVQVVVDILDGYTGWTLSAPEVYEWAEVSQQEREHNPDPALYVWAPADATLDQFGAEYNHIDETRIVEVQVWDLDRDDVETYHQDVIDFFATYANDNEQNTPFHHIRPTSATDSRSEHTRQRTDHYIMSVQCDLHNHRDV